MLTFLSNQRQKWKTAQSTLACLFLYGFLPKVFAGEPGGEDNGFQGACENVNEFMNNVVTMLGAVSVAVVTVAVVFAGYQVAFAHKRLSDVAPILVGGLLIGGAGTIARWFVGTTIDQC